MGELPMGERGVTLLEVIVTAILLGMLASVASLGVNQYLINGKKRIAESDINTLAAATRLYLLEHSFPSGSTFDASAALVPSYLPELPTDPFAAGTGQYYRFEVTTNNGNRAIRIYSCGPANAPVQRMVK